MRLRQLPASGGSLLRVPFIRNHRVKGRPHGTSPPLYPSRAALLIGVISAAVLALSFLASARPSWAGANKGGMLILHCNQTLEFTNDGDFNGYSELHDCKNAVTEVPGEGQGVVYFVLAAFDDFASPAILSLQFGIELSSPMVEPIRGGPSGWDTFEVADARWPASGTGTGVFWNDGALTGRLNEVYWFVGYAYAGQTVKLTPHPTGVGRFADTSVPIQEDEIEGYGILGFGVKGFNPRCGETATGACCSTAGRCTLVSKDGCTLDPGYIYQGDNTTCSPNPCTPGVGSCCIRAECRILQWDECLDARGVFMGEGVGCDPTPCDFSRVETTWGTLKSTYRGW
jgi:hypothetical protein